MIYVHYTNRSLQQHPTSDRSTEVPPLEKNRLKTAEAVPAARRLLTGFTLIEVMVVLALLAILSVIAVGVFGNMRASEELGSIEERIVALIEEARSRTISGENNESYSVFIEESGVTLFVGTEFSGSPTVIREVTFPSNITASSSTFTNDTIIFDRLAGTADESGSFILLSAVDNASTTVTVTESGIVE